MNHYGNSPELSYSQNEIINTSLLENLLARSSISSSDLVYDIGAGRGSISRVLLKRAGRVIAIEKDPRAYNECRESIRDGRFELYLDDFLQFKLPVNQKYKVFSNIPFFHTADIIRKLLYNVNPPEDCYLIIQKEAAEKYAGIPVETLASLLLKPLFWIDIAYYFKNIDFRPVPAVDIVMLQVEKRQFKLVPSKHYARYRDFIAFMREHSQGTTKQALRHLFNYEQQRKLCDLLTIDIHSSPLGLRFSHYLGMFQFFMRSKRAGTSIVNGAERRIRKNDDQHSKIHRTDPRNIVGSLPK
jgi:23S rRNA (adenine-N6)-dimethyltransferase